MDEDTFSPDDLLAEGETGSEGGFRLSGATSELGTINPELHVYHRCGEEVDQAENNVGTLNRALRIPPRQFSQQQRTQQTPQQQHFDCPALVKIALPRQLVTQGEFPKNVYHVDTMQLHFDPQATRRCLD